MDACVKTRGDVSGIHIGDVDQSGGESSSRRSEMLARVCDNWLISCAHTMISERRPRSSEAELSGDQQ